MNKISTILIVILSLFLSVGVGFAQEPDQSEPGNACFEGGSMANKCDNPWAWVCGWYLIRYEVGIFTRQQVPAMCAILLPREIEQVAATSDSAVSFPWPPASCYYSDVYSLYIIWEGNQAQGPAIDLTWDGTCATPPHTGVGGFFFVSAPNSLTATAICTGYGYNFIDEVSSSTNTGAWPIYRCQIP